MSKAKLSLHLQVGYESLPIPDKIVIPIGQGKLGPLGYKQHESDPVTAEQFHIQFGDANRLKINLRMTGRIAVSGILPDLKLGGLKVEIMSNLALQNMALRMTNPVITRLDMPNFPGPADNLVRQLLNKHLLQKLTEIFEVELKTPLEKVMAQINQPSSFDLKVGRSRLVYAFNKNVEYSAPQLTLAPDGLHLDFDVTMAPEIKLMQHTALRGIMPASRSRRSTKPRPRKRK